VTRHLLVQTSKVGLRFFFLYVERNGVCCFFLVFVLNQSWKRMTTGQRKEDEFKRIKTAYLVEDEALYRVWLPFIGSSGKRDVEGVFFARRAEYRHALGHEISLGQLHGRFEDVTIVLTEDTCWEVPVNPASLEDIKKIAPCGVNPVASFFEQLHNDCYACCVCRECNAYYEAKEKRQQQSVTQ
jgi:hypothetical protein